MRRHRPTRVSQCVRPGALACVRPFAMTGSHKSGALHCDVRVAAQVRRVSPSGLPACLHPRMRRSEAARAWSTACWNVRRRVCCSGTRTRVLCSGCTALSQTSGHGPQSRTQVKLRKTPSPWALPPLTAKGFRQQMQNARFLMHSLYPGVALISRAHSGKPPSP